MESTRSCEALRTGPVRSRLQGEALEGQSRRPGRPRAEAERNHTNRVVKAQERWILMSVDLDGPFDTHKSLLTASLAVLAEWELRKL